MYCSTCGVAVAQGVSYCNYCGAKLNRDDSSAKSPRPESLLFAMLATFVFGMVAITMFMGVMKVILRLPVDEVLLFSLLPFLVMLVLEGVFMRLLLRRKHADEKMLLKGQATKELDAARMMPDPRMVSEGRLPDARPISEQRASVTEHTTRAFDPIYTERKER